MRPYEEKILVRRLARDGLNISQIGRAVGVSRPTVRASRVQLPARHVPRRRDDLRGRRRCYRLRIFMDSRYPAIISEVAGAMTGVMPTSLVKIQPKPPRYVVEIDSHSNAWPCLFPQHGPGRKHERKIELAAWQETMVDREPEQFVRGLLHSDGCRVINRVVVNGTDYAYPRSFFTQVSKDIQALFCRSLERLDIGTRLPAGAGSSRSPAPRASPASTLRRAEGLAHP